MSLRYPILASDGTSIGFSVLNPFPGNPSILVSNHACIFEEFRGQGYGMEAHENRLKLAYQLGADVILSTVRGDNLSQQNIMAEFEHKRLLTFESRFSGIEIDLWGKVL